MSREVEPLYLPDGIPAGWYITRLPDGWLLAQFKSPELPDEDYDDWPAVRAPQEIDTTPRIIRELKGQQ